MWDLCESSLLSPRFGDNVEVENGFAQSADDGSAKPFCAFYHFYDR